MGYYNLPKYRILGYYNLPKYQDTGILQSSLILGYWDTTIFLNIRILGYYYLHKYKDTRKLGYQNTIIFLNSRILGYYDLPKYQDTRKLGYQNTIIFLNIRILGYYYLYNDCNYICEVTCRTHSGTILTFVLSTLRLSLLTLVYAGMQLYRYTRVTALNF